MATINLRGQTTTAPVTTKATPVTNLSMTPGIPTPISPTTPMPGVAPTASGVGAPQQTAITTMNTTPEGGFIPMVNTPFTQRQLQGLDLLAGTPESNADIDAASQMLRGMSGTRADLGREYGLFYDQVGAGTKEFDPSTMVSPYMNPYIQNVIDPVMARLRRERDITQSGIAEGASRVGAFGGTREGVQRSLNDEAFDRNTAETTSNLYYGGFNDAITRAMQNFENARGRNMGAAGLALQATQPKIENERLGVTNTANAARMLADIGQQRLGNYGTRAQNILGAGTMEQELQQRDLDAVNREIASQQGFDKQRAQDLLAILSGLPTSGGTSTTKPGMGWSDILGGTLASGAGDISTMINKLFSKPQIDGGAAFNPADYL